MTEQEANNILLECLQHTSNSRADFFKRKAIEGNYNQVTFYLDLSEAYKRIETFLNTDRLIGTDGEGNPVFTPECIFFPYAIGLKNTFGREDLLQILEPLHEFGLSLKDHFMNAIKKHEEEPKSNMKLKSFSWTGSPEQLEKLYEGLINPDYGFIDPNTDLQSFTAIFADSLTGCPAIKWKGSNRLLSYLFNQMCAMNLIVKEWQNIIGKNKLFQNTAGKYLSAHDLTSALTAINDLNHGLNQKEVTK